METVHMTPIVPITAFSLIYVVKMALLDKGHVSIYLQTTYNITHIVYSSIGIRIPYSVGF